MAKILEEHQELPIPIEHDVTIKGLNNPTFLVIIGFSGLSVLEAAKRSRKEIKNVLIIEPSLAIFKQTIRREWVGSLAREDTIDLLVGISPDEMLPHIQRIFTEVDRKGSRTTRCLSTEIVYDPFIYLDKDGKPLPIADKIVSIVQEASKNTLLAMGCASDSHFRWEQMIRNEKNLADSYRIAPLFKQFEGVPTVVVGAGPSMSDFITAYHEYKLKDKCLIIACDASLRKLLQHDIRPHIVTRCERKFTQIFDGVKKEDTKDIYYAAYPWCDPKFFDNFENSFMLYRANGVCKWTTPYEHGNVDGGVSSANAALELAFLFGAKQIYLTGVDLCFKDGKSHADGTMVEFDPEHSKAKWKQIPGNSGEQVTTIPVWERCLAEYRGALHKHKDLGATVFNTSQIGAKIEGTKLITWEEAQDRITSQDLSKNPLQIIKSRLEKHPQGYAETFSKKRKETLGHLKSVLKDFERLFLSIEDYMLLGKREEEKCVQQLKSWTDPIDYFSNQLAVKKALKGVYAKPCTEIDQFKSKYYADQNFAPILLDICMMDVAQVENKLSALCNVVEVEHERLRHYVTLHVGLFRTLEYYTKHLVQLLEKGPDQTVQYKEPKVLEAIYGSHR